MMNSQFVANEYRTELVIREVAALHEEIKVVLAPRNLCTPLIELG